MRSELPSAATLRSPQPEWYQAYFEAMVERNRNQALLGIERARHAIKERTLELRHVAPSSPREMQDLVHALTYLAILLMHIDTDTGDLLWD
jgi:hypothetical protein